MKLLASFSFRLTLLYAGLFAASAALLLLIFYAVAIRAPFTLAQAQVSAEAETLAALYETQGGAALAEALDARAVNYAGRRPFHAFVEANGRIVTANLPSWPLTTGADWLRLEADLYREGDEDDYEALGFDRTFDDGARLLVGRDIEDLDEREEAIAESAIWLIGGALLLGAAGGGLMSRAIGIRIDEISRAARMVIAGDMSGRVPVRGSGDDFDQLSETLNLMLARIEGLIESVRRVSDNVAHELRTPLARLHADLAEMAGAAPERREALHVEALEEAERLNAVFNAVLRIARLESGRHAIEKADIDIGALLRDAAELYGPAADDAGLTLDADIAPGLSARGDRDLLFQAVSNLLDNAVKYTPRGGKVRLSGVAEKGGVRISVRDDGPGMSEAERARAAERFYRGAAQDRADGAGLGLSLVAAIAALHGARLDIADAGPGLSVALTMPQTARA